MTKIDYLKDLFSDEDEEDNKLDNLDNELDKLDKLDNLDNELDNLDIIELNEPTDFKKYIINKPEVIKKNNNIIIKKEITIELPSKKDEIQVEELIDIISIL